MVPMPNDNADLLAPNVANQGRSGVGLCLSGGGYRAMLFHAGALLRLNEFGLLSRLDFVSSVSGGSIAAGVLAQRWSHLRWDQDRATNLTAAVVDPIMDFAGRTIDVGSVLAGVLLPWQRVSDRVIAAYAKHLFGTATLQDLPDHPRFIFCATNLQSGSLLRMSKPYLRDWRVGKVAHPTLELAAAVAASSAFPPVLSPVVLRLPPASWAPVQAELGRAAYRDQLVLSDGGVYDNLGLEPVIKRCATILVSDGGGHLAAASSVASDWARHTRRVLGVVDQQVRNLRSRTLIDGYRHEYDGSYWGIRTPIQRYGAASHLPAPEEHTRALAEIPTRLARLPVATRRRLVNWGYAGCDASIRSFHLPAAGGPADFPFPTEKVG